MNTEQLSQELSALYVNPHRLAYETEHFKRIIGMAALALADIHPPAYLPFIVLHEGGTHD